VGKTQILSYYNTEISNETKVNFILVLYTLLRIVLFIMQYICYFFLIIFYLVAYLCFVLLLNT
jgi:hypothetical protein